MAGTTIRTISLAASNVLARFGYGPVIRDRNAPKNLSWDRTLTSTLYENFGITMLPAMAPAKFSIDLQYVLYSRYVAERFRSLGLDLGQDSYAELPGVLVLSFWPARLRWNEDASELYPTIKVSESGELAFEHELEQIYSRYVAPVSSVFTGPEAVAMFQMASAHDLTTRERQPRPKYSVVNEYVSTALLFLEAGNTERARSVIESGIAAMEKLGCQNARSQTITARLTILRKHIAGSSM